MQDGHFVQHVADNVEHNVRTRDGLGTIHGMGIIAAMTLTAATNVPVPLKKSITTDGIQAVGQINTYRCTSFLSDTGPLIYMDLVDMKAEDNTKCLDVLWNLLFPVHSPRPAWSGIMQMIHKGTTMKFISNQATQYKFTPIITFDQPLWWKVFTIIQQETAESKLKVIVL